jgi:hypothetical protein
VPAQQPAYAQQPVYAQPTPVQQPVPPHGEPTKKKNRKPLIIAASALLVIVLGVGGFFGVSAIIEGQRSEAYAAAITLMQKEDYASALTEFEKLGDYKSSYYYVDYCTQGVAYQDAGVLLLNKDYEAARKGFSDLGSFLDAENQVKICDAWIAFEEAQDLTDAGNFEKASVVSADFSSVYEIKSTPEFTQWSNKNNYGLADLRLSAGQFANAYTLFTSLGSYSDSAARAQGCIQPLPANGELYHNDGFRSSSTDLTFDASSNTSPNYIKIYSGDTLVSTIFVHPGATATIQLPAGDYLFKDAVGNNWFGEGADNMFGKDGRYGVMLFDGSNEVTHLDGNMIYTITLYGVADGNVGSKSTDSSTF